MIVRSFEHTRREKLERHRRVVEAARKDINVFARYVLGIRNTDFHKFMQAVVDSERRRITFDAPTGFGKSSQFEIVRPIFKLGQNANEMMALISSTPKLPRDNLTVVRQHIEENERLHEVFPRLKLTQSTQFSVTVDRPRSMLKDPSIVALGIEGQILGRRWTWMLTDDILRFSSTYTDHMRELVWRRLNQECFGRLTAGAQHVDIGTPWVKTDARHRLRRMRDYLFLRFDGWTGECYDLAGNLVRKFDGGLWPTASVDPISGIAFGWPRSRLEEARGSMPAYEFDRQIRCLALSDSMSIFGDALDFCLRLGSGIVLNEEVSMGGKVRVAWRRPEPSWRYIFTGIDLGIDDVVTSDDTAFYTGAIDDRRRHVLELRRGRIQGPDIVRQMIEIVRRYPLHLGFRVESNLGLRFLQQFAEEPGLVEALGATKDEADRIRLFSHTTGSNKYAENIGIGAMAVEFEQRRWAIPCDGEMAPCDLVHDWMVELKGYDRVSHPGDMLIASWLFWEQTRGVQLGEDNWSRFGIMVPK